MPNDLPDQEEHANKGVEPEGMLTELSHEELIQKLNEAEQKANENWERLLRIQAENDNLLRRTERDVANAHKYALEKFVGELLPIVDSLELAVTHEPEKNDQAGVAILEGVKLTLKMFYTAMDKFGIKQVNPVGNAFDPEFEQAISMQHDPRAEPGTVLSVLQKGYTLNNRLVRPALVIVAKKDG